MIARLVFFIGSLVAIAFFTGLNLDNKCDIWFFWTTFKNVPVFISIMIAFASGALVSLFTLLISRRNKNDAEEERISKKRKEKTHYAENKITYDKNN